MDKELHESALIAAATEHMDSTSSELTRMQSAIAAYLKTAGLTVVPVNDLKRAKTLLHVLTVRSIIEAGDDAIDAAGLNPWAMNEGLAEGSERFDAWFLAFPSPFDEVKR